jgi:hypothetical protein
MAQITDSVVPLTLLYNWIMVSEVTPQLKALIIVHVYQILSITACKGSLRYYISICGFSQMSTFGQINNFSTKTWVCLQAFSGAIRGIGGAEAGRGAFNYWARLDRWF